MTQRSWTNLPKEYKRNKEIRYSDVQHIECYCFGCGEHIGGVDYVDSSFSYMLHVPLCGDCWKRTGWKMVQPKVTRGFLG